MRSARHTTEIYNDVDNVYLNISFQPPYLSNGPYLLDYNVTKDTPILSRMLDYYLSVIRFDIPLEELPITIAPPLPDQNPSDMTYPNITPYYWVHDYNFFMQMINNALLASYNATTLPALFPDANPPYFTYDSVTQLISLIVPSFFVALTSPAVAIPTINFNFNFLQYIDGFASTLNGLNTPDGFDIRIDLTKDNVKDINAYGPDGQLPSVPPLYYKVTQGQVLIQYWNP